ncbi:MAG: RagB/SusD family nutrient uptake outer membrane protein, partial [Hymenobacter sp.]
MQSLTRISRRLLVPALLSLASCNFLDVGPPPTQVVDNNVFVADASASAAVLGIYVSMTSGGFPGIAASGASTGTLATYAGLSADELLFVNNQFDDFRLNQINAAGAAVQNVWSQAYQTIYQCNAAVNGLTASTTLTASLRNQLLGEAKFMRAFNYFYLTNIYGDVPLVLTTDYTVSGTQPRAPRADVYAQVLLDLLDAQQLLVPAYPVSGERTRANQAAATALLARVYLYQQNWAAAEAQASAVIALTGQYQLPALGQVFLAGSPEAIWQLRRSGNVSTNTYDGANFIPVSLTVAPTATYVLTNALYSAFGTPDNRRTAWASAFTVAGTTYRYPFKYQQRLAAANAGAATEYNNTLRLAEQYLIRAEARIQQGNTATGLADLNVVRARAAATP